jgi:hypothetical protein
MFLKRTVFVVGAGASHEIGLPLGSGLMEDIANVLSFPVSPNGPFTGDKDILDALRRRAGQLNEKTEWWLDGARKIRNNMALAISIDNYINDHKDDERIQLAGKLAILKTIFNAEKASKLYPVHNNSETGGILFEKLQKTWLASLFKMLIQNRSAPSSIFENFSIICFNYDRCIEHFLFWAIKSYYHLTEGDAKNIVETLAIHHPYGTLGPLPWQDMQKGVAFGGGNNPLYLSDLLPSIRTFTEEVSDSESLAKIQSLWQEAEQIIFLGFAYHPMNLDILGPAKSPTKQIFGTSLGLSGPNQSAIETQLLSMFSNDLSTLTLQGIGCHDLLEQFFRPFTGL